MEIYSAQQQNKSIERKKKEENCDSKKSLKKYTHLNLDRITKKTIKKKSSFEVYNDNPKLMEDSYYRIETLHELDSYKQSESPKLPKKMILGRRSIRNSSLTRSACLRNIQKEKEKILLSPLNFKLLRNENNFMQSTDSESSFKQNKNNIFEFNEEENKYDSENYENYENYEKYAKNAKFSEEEILKASYKNINFRNISEAPLSPVMRKIIIDKKNQHNKSQYTFENKKDENELGYKDCSLCKIF